MSMMKVVSGGNGEITLQDFICGCQTAITDSINNTTVSESCLTPFLPLLKDCDNVAITDAEMSAIVFIAGYVGFKLKSKIGCFDCQCELLTQRVLECDYPVNETYDYLSKIDRGRLTWPTELMVDLVVQTIVVFKSVTGDLYGKEFRKAGNQRSIIVQLAQQRCQQVGDLSYQCSLCNSSMADLAKMCIKIVCNISLNNYTKRLADHKTESKTLKKLSTLTK